MAEKFAYVWSPAQTRIDLRAEAQAQNAAAECTQKRCSCALFHHPAAAMHTDLVMLFTKESAAASLLTIIAQLYFDPKSLLALLAGPTLL